MSRRLVSSLRALVAEDLAGPEGSGLVGNDRREYARQQIFLHLDGLTGGTGAVGPVQSAIGAAGSEELPGGDRLAGPSEEAWDEQRLAQAVLDGLFGMGGLQTLIDDSQIENIDINGCDRVWATFADGCKQLMPPVADSDDELIDLVRAAAGRFGLSERRFDLARPELDLRLPDGSRLSALMAVTSRPAISIRRHRYADLSLDDLVGLGTVSEELAGFLRATVRASQEHCGLGSNELGKDHSVEGSGRRDPRT